MYEGFFCLFGFPDAILSDQGTQFESNDFKNFLLKFKINKLRTNSYHPQGNGICERFNGTFKKTMLSYLTAKGASMSQWSTCLHHCLLDYRTTVHSATNCRPVDLFLGFNAKGYLPSPGTDRKKANDYVFKEKTKRTIDKFSRNRLFNVGDVVLCLLYTSPSPRD